MQDRYLGDIGDFAKFGLLRELMASGAAKRLGVLWYLVPDESHTNDGRHISYLEESPGNHERFRRCDPSLYDTLGGLVRGGTRCVSAIGRSGLLPPGTLFHNQALSYRGVRKADRKAHRGEWLTVASKLSESTDLVFLDPDNGLEVGVDRHAAKGPKYTYYDDLDALNGEDRTLIVYQHANRHGSMLEQIQGRLGDLQRRLGRPAESLFALRWRRISPRAFLVASASGHRKTLRARAQSMLNGSWGAHFEMIDYPE